MKRFKFYLLLMVVFSFCFLPNVVKASSFSVSASSYNVSVGSKVTVYIKGSDVTGRFNISSSDNSIFSGGDSKWIENDTVAVTFTAKSAGRVNINVAPTTGISNSKGEIIKLSSKSIQLTSYIPRALSSDNYLSSLSVDGVDIVPSFDKDTTNYIVDLEAGTTKININAEKANKYASVSGTGEVEVKEGSNDIEVIVTAENGSKRTYKITAVVKEFDPIKVSINGSDFTVVRKKEELVKPDFYEETTVSIDDNVIPAFYSSKTGYTLVGLKDVTGDVHLYIYNKNTKSYESYISLEFNKMNLIISEADESKLPKGFVKDTITINKQEVLCYKNNELGITLIYGKSIMTGEENFYEFENTDLTIQKFNFDAYNKLDEKITLYTYVILGLGGLTLLMLLCLIISVVNNKNKLKHEKVELEKTMNLDITTLKNAPEMSKKEVKKLEKKKKKEEEQQKYLEEQKRIALEEAEEEKRRIEAKEQKKKNKKDKKNKVESKENDDDMFYL